MAGNEAKDDRKCGSEILNRSGRLTLSIVCAPLVFLTITMVTDKYSYIEQPSAEVLLTAIIAFPFLEEFIFRGLLHERLLSINKLATRVGVFSIASLMVAALFAFAHVVLREQLALVAVFIPALVIGVHYEDFDQSWMLAFVIHAWYNLVWIGSVIFVQV